MTKHTSLILTGLDGSNPLAFLAALGTLRTLSNAVPNTRDVYMRWVQHNGAWRPEVTSAIVHTPESCSELLQVEARKLRDYGAFDFADNLNVTPEIFRAHGLSTVAAAHRTGTRIAADFASAFACDALVNEQMNVQDTALRTMAGAGHQHFLASMRTILENTEQKHIFKALFSLWMHDDPIAKQSLRWDPTEDSRYALQWRDPSGDPARTKRGTMLGANCLAIAGLPLLTSAPESRSLRTVGFKGKGASSTYWTWPIWKYPLTIDVCRCLLAHPLLQRSDAASFRELQAMGVRCAFQSQRITIGKFRNFTPSKSVF